MNETSLDLFHIFLFVIPGFVSVWSYHYFAKKSKPSDFEYFGLSVFFGLVVLVMVQFVTDTEEFANIIKNPYAASLVFSIFGMGCSWGVNYAIGVADDIHKNWRYVWKWLKRK